MVERLEILDFKKFERIKTKIKREGKEKLHVVADFDRTLTKAFVNGKLVPSVISLLRNGDYINENYSREAKTLADYYRPIEMDIKIPVSEKKEKMKEWWQKHFDLLIKSGLNKKHLKEIIKSKDIQFRDGSLEFIDTLHKQGIPLVILSSNGVGDTIPMLLEREGRLYDNINIITNLYEWGSKGNAVGVHKPIIHVMNKEEVSERDLPIFKQIAKRKNIILLGDSLGDLGMVHGFDYDNLLKFGFLDEDVEKNLKVYKENFDVVLTNDEDFNFINKTLKEILK